MVSYDAKDKNQKIKSLEETLEDKKFYEDNKEEIDERIKEIREERKKKEEVGEKDKPKNKVQELTDQVENQDDISERDLNAFQEEADALPKNESTEEDRVALTMAISKRRGPNT